MTAPAFVLAASGVAGLLALLLSFVTDGRIARRLAVASLWLALAAVPCSIAWDLAVPPTPMAGASSKATVVMPFAGIAMIAMRRASTANSKRARSSWAWSRKKLR